MGLGPIFTILYLHSSRPVPCPSFLGEFSLHLSGFKAFCRNWLPRSLGLAGRRFAECWIVLSVDRRATQDDQKHVWILGCAEVSRRCGGGKTHFSMIPRGRLVGNGHNSGNSCYAGAPICPFQSSRPGRIFFHTLCMPLY